MFLVPGRDLKTPILGRPLSRKAWAPAPPLQSCQRFLERFGRDLKTPISEKNALGAGALFYNFEVGVRGPSPQPIYEKWLFLNPAPVPRRALKNEIAPLRSGL